MDGSGEHQRKRYQTEEEWLPRGAEDGRSKTKEKPMKMRGGGSRSPEGSRLRDHAPRPASHLASQIAIKP